MKLIQEIDKKLEEYEEVLNVNLFEWLSKPLDTIEIPNDFADIKDVNKKSVLKNKILIFFLFEKMEKYNAQDKEARSFIKQTEKELRKLNERLEENGLNYIYEGYQEHHILNRMECLQINVYQQSAEVSSLTKENFIAHGIEDLYNPKMATEEMKKLLDSADKKIIRKNVDCIFNNNFLEEVLLEAGLDLDKKELFNLKKSLYIICSDIDEAVSYAKLRHRWEIYKELAERLNENMLTCSAAKLIRVTNEWKKYFSSCREEEKKDTFYKIGILTKTKQYLENPDLLKKNLNNLNFSLLQSTYFGAIGDIFKIVLTHQKKQYQNLLAVNKELKEKKNTTTVEEILRKENMILSVATDEEKKELLTIQDPSTFVKKLKTLNITTDYVLTKEFITMLDKYSSKEINNYSYLIEKGYISRDTAFKLMNENTSLDKINENLDFLMSQKIEPKISNYDEDILFLPIEQLKTNENLLFSFYHKNKSDNNFNYFYNPFYIDALDFLIENGLNVDLLDNNKLTKEEMYNFIKRTQICLSLDIDIYTASGNINRSFLLGKGFYCKTEDLDKYMLVSQLEDEEVIKELKEAKRDHINDEIYNLEAMKKLEEYRSEDGLIYEIEEMSLSRPKVMRNLTYFYEQNKITENNILQSIIFNSNLENKEIETIKEKIIPLGKRKQM